MTACFLGRTLFAVSCLGLLSLSGRPSAAMQAADSVTVDAAARFQTMQGFGSSERVFDDPHVFENFNSATGRSLTTLTTAQQDEVLDRLYVDLALTRVRPATEAAIETANDNGDPLSTDLAMFNFAWKRNDAHMDYVQRARSRGLRTYFLSPVVLESWMDPGTDKREYVEWAMAVIRRWRDAGVDLPYYSIVNEPGYVRSGIWSGEWLRDVIKLLGAQLRAEGFATMIVTPNDVRSSTGAARTSIILADAQARQYVGALATHLYDEPVSNVAQMKALSDQYGIPLWMTEFSVAAMPSASLPADALGWGNLMHELIASYNVTAIDYMWGFFGSWENPGTHLVRLNYNGAQYLGYELTKPYYVMGQYSRFVKPGARRIGAASTAAGITVTAYLDGSTVSIVALNTTTSSRTLPFSLSGISGVTSVQAVRTSTGENWVALPTIPASGSAFTAALPANSITTFTITGAATPGDSDADGLPDQWETLYFNGLSQGSSDDPDGDGRSNAAEFAAGTDPTVSNSSTGSGTGSSSGGGGCGATGVEFLFVVGLALARRRIFGGSARHVFALDSPSGLPG